MMNSVVAPINVTRLTATARGAVAVLRIDVPHDDSASILDRHFVARNGITASAAEIGRILYGDWGAEDVVVVRVGPRQWEVNCHGGEVAVNRITNQLQGGTEISESPPVVSDFIQQIDSTLLQLLLACRTQQTANYVLAQQQGVLQRFVCRLDAAKSWESCHAELTECLSWKTFADHLTSPWQVAIVGQPNAGKSSLLNAIVGFDRSIVFDQPGTTRDRVEAEIVLGGWPFLLVDTAGIREQVIDEIESVGVESAKASLQDADACLLVVDAVHGWTRNDEELLNRVPEGCPCAVAFNKSDLAGQPNTELRHDVQVIETSAVDGSGISELVDWLPNQLLQDRPNLQTPLPLGDDVQQLLLSCLEAQSLLPLKNRMR